MLPDRAEWLPFGEDRITTALTRIRSINPFSPAFGFSADCPRAPIHIVDRRRVGRCPPPPHPPHPLSPQTKVSTQKPQFGTTDPHPLRDRETFFFRWGHALLPDRIFFTNFVIYVCWQGRQGRQGTGDSRELSHPVSKILPAKHGVPDVLRSPFPGYIAATQFNGWCGPDHVE